MKVFVTIIIILLLLRWLLKPLIKFTVLTTFSKMADEAMRRQQQSRQPTKKEGTISVDYVPEKGTSRKGSSASDGGDYIDYEELK
jgi:hypothetical protein